MIEILRPLIAAMLATGVAGAGATMTSSAASDSLGTSSVGSSNSIARSSNNSSGNNQTAAGDYRIVDVAQADDRPGTVRMTLAGTTPAQGRDPLHLYVPRDVAEQSGLARGDLVHARARSYGVEFSDGRSRKAFFLVLDDPVWRELKLRAVSL